MKKEAFVRFYHYDAHYYVTISHNTSVSMIGHLELAIGTLTSRVMSMAYKNLMVSHHEVGFFSDASKRIWIRLWTNLSRSDWSDLWLWTQPRTELVARRPVSWSNTQWPVETSSGPTTREMDQPGPEWQWYPPGRPVEARDESWSPRSNATALAGFAITTTTTMNRVGY